VEGGGVASVHWKDINSLIDADMDVGIFGPDITPARIQASTGLLAKQEVSQYLRENPSDMDGAMKLYEGIVKNDKAQSTKEFYRGHYKYGQAIKKAGVVLMSAPDGRKLEVPTNMVEEMLKKGATKR
jgi:hypothetical protein